MKHDFIYFTLDTSLLSIDRNKDFIFRKILRILQKRTGANMLKSNSPFFQLKLLKIPGKRVRENVQRMNGKSVAYG